MVNHKEHEEITQRAQRTLRQAQGPVGYFAIPYPIPHLKPERATYFSPTATPWVTATNLCHAPCRGNIKLRSCIIRFNQKETVFASQREQPPNPLKSALVSIELNGSSDD